MDEQIKQAFSRVKQDIFSLGDEINKTKLLIAEMKNELKIITQALNDIREKEILAEKTAKTPEKTQINIPTHPTQKPTIQQITPTQEEIPTDKLLSQVLKRQNMTISTGNRGVPTDRQTNQQTNRHIIQQINGQEKPEQNQLQRADEILASLDALKKELRIKIKRLTNQEMQVFSLLYSLEQQGQIVDYPLLSSNLQLSESSIRDYIGKIQKKGIPITKEKLNNKKILLHISPKLKKIASLDTILKLREL